MARSLLLSAIVSLSFLVFIINTSEVRAADPSETQLVEFAKQKAREGKLAEADAALELVLSKIPVLDPKAAPFSLLALLARIKYEQGNDVETMRYLNKIIEFGVVHYLLHYYRGSVYADQGMGEEAFADLNKALKLNPNHIGSLVKKAMIIISLANNAESETKLQQMQADAGFLLHKATRLVPETEDDLENLAGASLQLGDMDMAEAYAQRALELNPKRGLLYYFRCAARMNHGDYSHKSDCQRALELMNPATGQSQIVKQTIQEIERLEQSAADGTLFDIGDVLANRRDRDEV